MIILQSLLDFKKGKNISSLKKYTVKDLNKYSPAIDINIYLSDVISLLKNYLEKKITLEELMFWGDTVFYSDIFDYDEFDVDSISEIVSQLEGLDQINSSEAHHLVQNLYDTYKIE